MSLFVVYYEHADLELWHEYREPHLAWIQTELESGRIRASGPNLSTDPKSAMLIIATEDREELDVMLAEDPFTEHGVVTAQTITEWDPIFGAFITDSSRSPERT